MHSRVDPSSPLTEEHIPSTRRNCMSDGIRCELHLECREMLHHKCREVPIFSEGEEILLVESIDIRLRVFVNNE